MHIEQISSALVFGITNLTGTGLIHKKFAFTLSMLTTAYPYFQVRSPHTSSYTEF